MKMKLTSLMFGLLLAVGWTSNAFAQSTTFTAESIKGLTYDWVDANGNTQTSHYVELNAETGKYYAPEVYDPYQIYGLLRGVYMEKELPGPTYSAYKADGTTREREVYYGGVQKGWNIPGTHVSGGGSTSTIGAKTITISSNSVKIKNIRVVSGTTLIAGWDYETNGTSLPTGWSFSSTPRLSSETVDGKTVYYMYFNSYNGGGTITIPASVTAGYPNVEIVINAATTYTATASVTGGAQQSILYTNYVDYAWNFNAVTPEVFASDTYKPREEGYTALVVSLKNTPYLAPEPSGFGGSTAYTQPSEVINYIAQNIQFVKLLTDGLRITDAGGNPGTVFNCDGTFNKFFFLGKGKARKKGAEVQSNITAGTWPDYTGECVIFWPMYEDFSPQSAKLVGGSTTVDFFDRMMEGNIYDVVHDCAGVIQNRHEFSLAGESGTQDYPFTGMNFFIPDYRLKYWVGTDSLYNSSTEAYDYYSIDGRDMNAINKADGSSLRAVSEYYSNFAQYNPQYAPKVGIYKITLDAEAEFVGNAENPSHEPGNKNYKVTLTWVSSLNEMAGHDVPQTYTVYYYDPKTGERKYVVAEGITDGKTGLTTVSYLVDQEEHSYIIDHIVMGTPDNNTHPTFVAWSNHASVVIPGWDDFVGLVLDHHESDFVIEDMANWYRNFLAVINEDVFNGLTVSKISGDENTPAMNSFNLYRYELDKNREFKEGTGVKIANLKFDQLSAEQVRYTVTYDADHPQQQLKPAGETNKYDLDEEHLNVPLTGFVRVKGNGDIVIWPNGYHVNFKSITIKNNGRAINGYTWTSADSDLPSTMKLSSGSVWEEFNTTTTGDKVGYIEGGGYIYIPNMLNNSNYSNLTVEIVAYGEGSTVNTIMVNDRVQSIANNTAKTYTWGGNGQDQTPLSPNAAPRRATTTDVTFTAANDRVAASTITKDGVTITNTHTTGNNSFNYSPYRLYAGTTTFTVASGSITKIEFAGSNITRWTTASTGSWNPSASSATWTGNASSVTFSGNTAQVNCSSIVVTVSSDGSQEEMITYWDYNETPTQQPQEVNTDWILDDGGKDAGIDEGYGFWFNNSGSLTIPASYFENYTDIRVEISYALDNSSYYSPTSCYASVNGSQGAANTTSTFRTYTWNNVDASNGIVIVPSTGYLYFKYIKVYGTPKGGGDTPQPGVEGGLLRMHLLIVDQLKADIPDDNSHADGYGYVLKYEPNGDGVEEGSRESATVKVDIQKTGCEVEGYYTLDEIDHDTNIGINHDEGIVMDVMTADVKFDLTSDNNLLDSYILDGKADTEESFYGMTKLEQTTDFSYIEMLEGPDKGHRYDSGEHHYYDKNYKLGNYASSFMSYAPSVSTWGIERRYFEEDGLDNTYGAPIWKTAVGDARLESATAQKQFGWNTNWDSEGQKSRLYILDGIEAVGLLPHTDITNIDYEPYMFRIFVESKEGKLRPFTYETVTDEDGKTREVITAGEGTTTGPLSVWEQYIKYDNEGNIVGDPANGVQISVGADKEYPSQTAYTFYKTKVERDATPEATEDNPNPERPAWDKDEENAIFGALEALNTTVDNNGNEIIDPKDLTIFVRFYYVVKGAADGHTPDPMTLRAGGVPYPAGYGAESPGKAPGHATAVNEIQYLGEIVSQTYYNTQGMVSDKPFDGVNIVVTRFGNGTTSVSKIVR